jgi:hypothetical protein
MAHISFDMVVEFNKDLEHCPNVASPTIRVYKGFMNQAGDIHNM